MEKEFDYKPEKSDGFGGVKRPRIDIQIFSKKKNKILKVIFFGKAFFFRKRALAQVFFKKKKCFCIFHFALCILQLVTY